MISLPYMDEQIKIVKFPAGELNVELSESLYSKCINANALGQPVEIYCVFQGNDDLVALGLLKDLFDSRGISSILNLPYFPAARQDRQEGLESFGLRYYASVIKNMGFKKIWVADPHSDVMAGMFPPGVLNIVTQLGAFSVSVFYNNIELFKQYENIVIVGPDMGSTKKAEKIYKFILENKDEYNITATVGLVIGSKTRDYATGKIKSIKANLDDAVIVTLDFNPSKYLFIVVDDICDGGATFTSIAKAINTEMGYLEYDEELAKHKMLFTTHGIYSRGKEELNKYFAAGVYCNVDLSVK